MEIIGDGVVDDGHAQRLGQRVAHHGARNANMASNIHLAVEVRPKPTSKREDGGRADPVLVGAVVGP
jgi:hypothetical protein